MACPPRPPVVRRYLPRRALGDRVRDRHLESLGHRRPEQLGHVGGERTRAPLPTEACQCPEPLHG